MDVTSGDVVIRGSALWRAGDRMGEFLLAANALDRATWPGRVGAGLAVVRTGFVEDALQDAAPLWLARPRGQWLEFAKHVEGLCGEGCTPVLWPRCGDVISDAPSTLSFVRGNSKWKFLVDPAGLMTPEMRTSAVEHMVRLIDLMVSHEACAGVVHPEAIIVGKALSMLENAVAGRGLGWWRIDGELS